jgi:hypothetical protein
MWLTARQVNFFAITVATSLLDHISQVINLANTIGKKPFQNLYTNKPSAQSKYLLPAQFNQNTKIFRKYTVSPIFECAAQSQGFNVTMKGWEQQYNKIHFNCRRGRFAQLKKEDAGSSCRAVLTHRSNSRHREEGYAALVWVVRASGASEKAKKAVLLGLKWRWQK